MSSSEDVKNSLLRNLRKLPQNRRLSCKIARSDSYGFRRSNFLSRA